MEKRIFKVYFKDGNEKLLGAETMYNALSYLLFVKHYNDSDIIKIEEV